jgi:VWFA-related protein
MIGPRIACIGLMTMLLLVRPAAAKQGPSDDEIRKAIEKGVHYLKSVQEPTGGWSFDFNHDHALGMTALAGLALLENGVPRDDEVIRKANEVVHELAIRSNQTYDISLAILFLARVQQGARGPNDELIRRLGYRLSLGEREGMWSYLVPRENERTYQLREQYYGTRRRQLYGSKPAGAAGPGADADRGQGDADEPPPKERKQRLGGPGDNSNTQFALLGIWAASRHGFDADETLAAIDRHFRDSQEADGGWGYNFRGGGSPAMSCAGLIGLAIAASRPELAAKETAAARGAALAADPVFRQGMAVVENDVRGIGVRYEVYDLWSLERLCVALGLKKAGGIDWYSRGAAVLLRLQSPDGSWPDGRWGKLPETCLALLFLRKANLAFEIDRVLRLPDADRPAVAARPRKKAETKPAATVKGDDINVVVHRPDEAKFPEIRLDFELRKADGSAFLDAQQGDITVKENGQPVDVVAFSSPGGPGGGAGEVKPTTVVLVVDRSKSMEEDDKIGALKKAVAAFLKVMPQGSSVAVVAFSDDVTTICDFTTDKAKVQAAVDALVPDGATRCFDALDVALDMIARVDGRRAILCLTDGEDTFSTSATLDGDVKKALRAKGAPIYTIGLGGENDINVGDLERLADETKGQYFPARRADELVAIFREFAVNQGVLYQVAYRTNREVPDGTVRPVSVAYRQGRKEGVATFYIPGMVVPKSGWNWLFLGLLAGLGTLASLPGMLARRSP